jgi:hypothetical protein
MPSSNVFVLQLGVLVFEMLSARLPFEAPDGTDAALFKLIAKAEFSWPAAEAQSDGALFRLYLYMYAAVVSGQA